MLQDRQCESGGLAGAGLRDAEQVMAGEQLGDGAFLDRRRDFEVLLGERAQDWLGQAERSKGRGCQSNRVSGAVAGLAPRCACALCPPTPRNNGGEPVSDEMSREGRDQNGRAPITRSREPRRGIWAKLAGNARRYWSVPITNSPPSARETRFLGCLPPSRKTRRRTGAPMSLTPQKWPTPQGATPRDATRVQPAEPWRAAATGYIGIIGAANSENTTPRARAAKDSRVMTSTDGTGGPCPWLLMAPTPDPMA